MLSRVLVGARSSRAVEKRWIFGAVAAALAGTSIFFGAVLSLRTSSWRRHRCGLDSSPRRS